METYLRVLKSALDGNGLMAWYAFCGALVLVTWAVIPVRLNRKDRTDRARRISSRWGIKRLPACPDCSKSAIRRVWIGAPMDVRFYDLFERRGIGWECVQCQALFQEHHSGF